MKLSEILKDVDFEYELMGEDKEVLGLYHNSKEVKENGMFFAINGGTVNGEDYIQDAIKNGAEVIVTNNKDVKVEKATLVYAHNVRLAMSLCASNFYKNPSQEMFIIGVTGTNGKTTTTYMLKKILETAGKKVGVIGTNGIVIGDEILESEFTTPDPILLQKTLRYMEKKGVDVVCMEVSAHALELQKIRGLMTDIALFTNLTQDHLDFFETMENYKNAKRKFFDKNLSSFAVINIDDPFGYELSNDINLPVVKYSREEKNTNFSEADIVAVNNQHNTNSQTFLVKTPKGEQLIDLKLCGGFNVSNALGAISASLMCGIDLKVIAKALSSLQSVSGRFNTYDVNGVRVIIDYAHTPDGLENVLRATREITEGKVYSVFGCGGNRDKTKRPIMGRISEELADYTFITSDNPRYEKPIDIIFDIKNGFNGNNYQIEVDRASAIRQAILKAQTGDSVVIAGKGCEPYIDQCGVKSPYQDEKVVKELILEFNK